MKIDAEDDVVLVRRRVRDLAQELGFDVFANAALTTATSEIVRNVWTHAGKGQATIEVLERAERHGVRLVCRDEGPGISNLERVLKGGFSTASSLGLGLAGSRRLVDEFHLESSVGRGTVVTLTKWIRAC
jgi:serine/threonine-protein kinase RsbT